MYFKECERLAEQHPELADIIQQVDSQLCKMGDAEVVRTEDFASFLGSDLNQVTSVFEMLARDGLLLTEKTIECPYCRMTVLRSEYETILEEEGEYCCTDCDRPLTNAVARTITTYRRGEKWKETLSCKKDSIATDHMDTSIQAQAIYYLRVIIKETVFDAETPELSTERAFDESRDYFYQVNDRALAQKLTNLFQKKLGDKSQEIGRISQVEFEFVSSLELDETDRFLIEEEISKLATEVSGYKAQWMLDCLELGEPPWVYDPNDPTLYDKDNPLSLASLYHQAEKWEEALTSEEEEAESLVSDTEDIVAVEDSTETSPPKLSSTGKTKMVDDNLNLTGEAKALALLVKYPHWTNKQIAKEVGCHPKSLSRWKSFRAAREVQKKEGKSRFSRGSKYPDQSIDAWDNSGENEASQA